MWMSLLGLPQVQHGYEYFAGGQLLTVFSAPGLRGS